MTLTFVAYWPAIFLLVIPILWSISKRTVTDQAPLHLHLTLFIRSLIVTFLALGLMQPMILWSGSDLSVVYLVDVSHSIAASSIRDTAAWIHRMNETGKPQHSRIVAFGSDVVGVDSPEQLTRIGEPDSPTRSLVGFGTNIGKALEEGLRQSAADHIRKLVLITDGSENAGSFQSVIPRLNSEQVRIMTLPAEVQFKGDTWIETISVPSRVTAGEAFPVEVEIFSDVEKLADIGLTYGEVNLGRKPVLLHPGSNNVQFDVRIDIEGGAINLIATATVPEDPFADNNSFSASVSVDRPPTILYVEGYAPSTDYLKDALTREGLRVVTMSPDAMPSNASELNSFEAVIVSDVAKDQLSNTKMQAIASYVHDFGGGLIFAGGENVYGENGYSGTPLESILPVTFETRKPPETVGMIVVLDKSGSMEGQNLEMSKEATKAPLEFLKSTDRFGVVAFDKSHYWAVDFQPVNNRQQLAFTIGMIPAFGDTNIYPALLEAYQQLQKDKSESRHIILLSDGVSMPGEFQKLTQQIASDRITVSTVAVGKEADRQLLRNIAVWGKGRAYYCEDPGRVPQVFVEESELTTGKSVREEPFQPVVRKAIQAFKGINLAEAPELLGYVMTTPRKTAEVLLETHNADPVLVRGQYGLGKSAVFTSDVKNRWAAGWISWPDYARFWAQLTRETMRRASSEAFDMEVRREDDVARVLITAHEKDGTFRNRIRPEVRIIAPDQSVRIAAVPQTGPGRYETRIPAAQKGTYLFRATATGADAVSRLLTDSYNKEYRFHSADLEKLSAIAVQTGGMLNPTAPDIFNTEGENTTYPMAFWPWLVALALGLYLLDVFLRRVRWFDPQG